MLYQMRPTALPSVYVWVPNPVHQFLHLWHKTSTSFPNDIALLSHNHEDAQTLITAVKQEALSVGLQINGLKIECMLVGNVKTDSG